MRRLGLILGVLIGLLAGLVPAAGAHPLGNFTVNAHLRVEASGDQLYLRHVIDMAEIPTLRERDRVDAAGGPAAYAAAVAPERAAAVEVTVDGRRLDVATVSQTAELLPGQGGLDVLRYAAWYRVAGVPAGGEVVVADRNLAGRQGWRDILVRTSSGAAVTGAEAVAEDLTDELRHYPDGALESAHRTEAVTFGWTPGDGPGAIASAIDDPASPGAAREDSGVAGLASSDLTTGAIVVSILLAMGWGALHSLSPGHGKTMVAAYLVGTRGRTRHALLLGAFVTVTHTVGVVALGLVTLVASRYILPEDLFPWINLVAALMVVAVGWWALRGRLRPLRARWAHARAHRRGAAHAHHGHAPHDHASPVLVAATAHGPAHHHHDHGHAGQDHDHGHGHGGHDHGHGHGHHHGPGGHTHAPPEDLSMRSLLAVGASAGLVPCPSALVLLLGAIALDRVGYGLVLVVAFSLGLAGLLSLIGILVLHARRLIDRVPLDGRLAGAVPALSALVIVALGVVLTARALPPLL